jgi:hypothetical protein
MKNYRHIETNEMVKLEMDYSNKHHLVYEYDNNTNKWEKAYLVSKVHLNEWLENFTPEN